MEFPFNINNLFADEISKVDNHLTPARNCPGGNEYRTQLSEVIDRMGEASATAQSLRVQITSGSKLVFSDHILYVMKDREVNNGIGAAIGILKIGTKKLFVYDSHGVHLELEPMCVLDFYVHESRQRTGCGRKLFDFMLKDQNMKAAHLAIDRPSHKFSQFLQKHYNLKATIPQVNNFVVFNGFFQDRNTSGNSRKNMSKPPLNPYRRQNTVPANSNHWFSSSSTQNNCAGSRMLSEEDMKNDKREALKDIPSSGRQNGDNSSPTADIADTNLSASKAMYSRHTLNPTPPLPDISRMSTNPTGQTRKVPSPPLLQRDGAPNNYQSMLNTHQDVYDRRGHLKISPEYTGHVDRISAPPGHHEVQQLNNTNPHSETRKVDTNSSNNVLNNGYSREHNDSNRLKNDTGPFVRSNPHTSGRPAKDDIIDKNSDVLLPKNFTPYSHLSLPPGDPYAYRESAQKLNNTSWNVFGVPAEPKSYSAKDRWRNTRPW